MPFLRFVNANIEEQIAGIPLWLLKLVWYSMSGHQSTTTYILLFRSTALVRDHGAILYIALKRHQVMKHLNSTSDTHIWQVCCAISSSTKESTMDWVSGMQWAAIKCFPITATAPWGISENKRCVCLKLLVCWSDQRCNSPPPTTATVRPSVM